MSPAVLTMLCLAAASYALKAAGPLVLGRERGLPPWLDSLASLLPAPLLAALVASSTFVQDNSWTVDAKVVGLVVAGIALWRNAPFIVVVLVASAATALTRALA